MITDIQNSEALYSYFYFSRGCAHPYFKHSGVSEGCPLRSAEHKWYYHLSACQLTSSHISPCFTLHFFLQTGRLSIFICLLALSISPFGNYLFIASRDGKIKEWLPWTESKYIQGMGKKLVKHWGQSAKKSKDLI